MTTSPAVDPTLEAAYLSGQARPHWPTLIADFAARSDAVTARADTRLDLPYGPHPRQRFDLVPARTPARAGMLFLHAGYWQARDKSGFRFLADAATPLGCDVAIANYPLAPDARVGEITEAVRALIPALRADSQTRHGRPLPIIVAGHSAGAHLAVELALTDWATRGIAAPPISGVLALSGVYDLAPLIATSLNRNLRLDAAEAEATSPVHRAARAPCPAVFAVGGGETSAFLEQNRRMAESWAASGAPAREMIVADDDHFSLLARLVDPASALNGALAALVG